MVSALPANPAPLPSMEPGWQTVHADEHLLVVEKPAGLLAVPGRGAHNADCLSARVQRRHPQALVVHRLDMATSGLMLFALTPAVQRLLGLAFQDRRVVKRYVAVVHGAPPMPDGPGTRARIDLPIGADWPDRPRRKIDPEHGKPSTTRYRVLRTDHVANRSRLELEPITGRTHQLRLHLSAIGHPIVGDALYAQALEGSKPEGGRLLLHATELELQHPVTTEALLIRSNVPF